MNYPQLRNTAVKLLKNFGNTRKCTLLKYKNGAVTEYNGVGVKLRYDASTIDGNIIMVGDAKVLCYFDVEPTEMVDLIKIENDTFDIIHSGDVSPDNITKILYTLQVRKNG